MRGSPRFGFDGARNYSDHSYWCHQRDSPALDTARSAEFFVASLAEHQVSPSRMAPQRIVGDALLEKRGNVVRYVL
jgi:hypothetical protein